MRDFARTAEPSGASQKTKRGNSFVIQQHAARRMHYDLRLELDGVLMSWSVPKGPSLSPAERPYSPRARAGAPVAVPIAWDELAHGVDPATFTTATVPRRLVTLREDPWKPMTGLKQSITASAWRAFGGKR